MAFQAPTSTAPRAILRSPTTQEHQSPSTTQRSIRLEESQEWILFSPSQIGSSTDRSSHTVGLSRTTSGLASLETAGPRSQLDSEALLDETLTEEDGELDTLDEGLHAFQQDAPNAGLYHTLSASTQQTHSHPLLPTHDGLGTFPFSASSAPVLEQLWAHEQYNPKRKHPHDGHQQTRRPSSVHRRLATIEEMEAQANEEKRVRIEKWRMDQSRAMLEEVERETRRLVRRQGMAASQQSQQVRGLEGMEDILGSTPRQSDYLRREGETEEGEADENEPFWRRLTRKFIRDIIGIDEPLLSVILGESLPEEAQLPQSPKPTAHPLKSIPESSTPPGDLDMDNIPPDEEEWRPRLLQRIARELGVCVYAISPHPGAFSSYVSPQTHDYAGMSVTGNTPPRNSNPHAVARRRTRRHSQSHSQLRAPPQEVGINDSHISPHFTPTIPANWTTNPTMHDTDDHDLSNSIASSSHLSETLDLHRERQYWEAQLDVRQVFRFLRERFIGRSTPALPADHHRAYTTNVGGGGMGAAAMGKLGSSPEEVQERSRVIREHHPLVARAAAAAAQAKSHSRPRAVGVVQGASVPFTAAAVPATANASQGVAVRRQAGSSCASESVKSRTSRTSSRGRGAGSGTGTGNYWDLGGSVGSGSLLASGGLWGEV